MVKKSDTSNKIVLRRGISIGTGNAESDDEFLFDCFVDYPAAAEAARIGNAGMVLAGRTGSGKTAILRRIEADAEQSVALDPFDMAMSYVANSDAIRFLEAIGADLDLLFQVLWKHVICIEFIRLKNSVSNEVQSRSFFSRMVSYFDRDQRKQKPIAYLKKWEGRFWITMDENIREITEEIEKKVSLEAGTEFEKFKAGGQFEKRMSAGKKSEIVHRMRDIVSQQQLSELHGVIDILSSFENEDSMRKYYILIDRLDERWVDDGLRFRLIKGLLETLRSFRKVRNLKILVALRTDVLERVVQETEDIAFQREKFEDYKINLLWSKSDLKLLVDKRIESLFRRQYTSQAVSFEDMFPLKIKQRDCFDWMIERTLMRPRDIIAFVNECLDASDGQSEVSQAAIYRAEVEYARKRRDALLQEWRSAYPTLDKLIAFLTISNETNYTVDKICSEENPIDDLCLSVCSERQIDFDPFHKLAQKYVEGKGVDKRIVVQNVVAILYRVGAVGVKINHQDRLRYAHLNEPLISPDLVNSDTRIRLHPMLWAAYNLQRTDAD
jgi:Trp operon repressor